MLLTTRRLVSVPLCDTAIVEAHFAAAATAGQKDKEGRTPLELPRSNNHAAVTRALEA